ncbi:MAG: NAD(P)-binding oxidoreductase [Candidatus Microsaccharimonas sp.]
MKNIVILGAAGRTGSLLVDAALEAGYKVTAFVRKGEQVEPRDNLVVIEGDARKADDLEFALGGQDAVISTLGSNKLKDDLITESTNALIKAMHANNVKRVIMMSSFLASGQLKLNLLSWVLAKISAGFVSDKQTGEELLKSSDLDWTIVYATRLGDGPATGKVRIVTADETVSAVNGIDRADVAAFLIGEVDITEHMRRAVLITTH